jgi:hypothetical protein
MHHNNKLVQANKKLGHQLERKRHTLALVQDKNIGMSNSLAELEPRVERRAEVHLELIRTAFALQSELTEKTAPVEDHQKKAAELRAEQLRLKELLDTRKREQVDAARTLAASERSAEVRRRKCEAEVGVAQSIRAWEPQRKLIEAALRKERVKLGASLTNIERATRNDAKLSQQIIELLHGDDPGDATGLFARQIVRAEIDAIPVPADGREVEIELEYEAELKEQLAIVSQAKKDLEDYRAKTLAELERELEQSSSDGYILLLQEDLNALKTKLAATRRR